MTTLDWPQPIPKGFEALRTRPEEDSSTNRLEFVKRLARGGIGSVYLCRDRVLRERLAVKILHREGDPRHADSLRKEARILIKLNHPNIVRFFHFGHMEDGQPYLAMEYLDGSSLRERLEEGPSLSFGQALEMTHQALLGLARLHREGISHGDLSPDNLMLVEPDSQGTQVKIIDLGASKSQNGTHSSVNVGKYPYLAPERFEQEPQATAASDIYSMGITFYQMLTGAHPYCSQGEDPRSISNVNWMAIHLNRDMDTRPLSSVPPDLGQQVEQLLRQMLSKDPRSRGSAQEIATHLGALIPAATGPTGSDLPAQAIPAQPSVPLGYGEVAVWEDPPAHSPGLSSTAKPTFSRGIFAEITFIAVGLLSALLCVVKVISLVN